MMVVGVGPGWERLLSQLADELRGLDPGAELRSKIDADGLLGLRARLTPVAIDRGRRAARLRATDIEHLRAVRRTRTDIRRIGPADPL